MSDRAVFPVPAGGADGESLPSLVTDAPRDTFTRDELLAAMTLSPCHITGTHDPTHTPKYVCTYQTRDALAGVLALLGVRLEDLPRQAHEWPPTGNRGVLEAAWVNRQPITFTVSNVPGESWQEFSPAWDAACEARKASQGKFRISAITEGMKEPEVVAYW